MDHFHADDDDSDSSSSLSDSDDDDDEDEEEEDEEDAIQETWDLSACPPGCDQQLYDWVADMRLKRYATNGNMYLSINNTACT